MGLSFCSDCGGLMSPFEEEGMNFMKCSGCGKLDNVYRSEVSNFVEKGKEIKEISFERDSSDCNHLCSKCGFGRGETFEKGVLVSDDLEKISFVKCSKCGFVEKFDYL